MGQFELDPRLEAGTVLVKRWPLSRVLLMNDARYPWLLLVPERPNISETFELSDDEQQQLHHESRTLARFMKTWFKADKMNVAAIGNMVPQLHVHHIARYQSDPVWPAPVWGMGEPVAYVESELADLTARLSEALPEPT